LDWAVSDVMVRPTATMRLLCMRSPDEGGIRASRGCEGATL
jgi:hypothetical protein